MRRNERERDKPTSTGTSATKLPSIHPMITSIVAGKGADGIVAPLSVTALLGPGAVVISIKDGSRIALACALLLAERGTSTSGTVGVTSDTIGIAADTANPATSSRCRKAARLLRASRTPSSGRVKDIIAGSTSILMISIRWT